MTETPHIGEGNSKLSGITGLETIPELSLPCKVTCNPDAPCCKKGCRMFSKESYRPTYHQANMRNLRLWQGDADSYWGYIETWIQFRKPKCFRPSVCGDAPNRDYVDGLMKMARACPDTSFMCFTKQPFFLDVTPDEKPDNLTIIASMWPGWRIYNPNNWPTSWCYGLNVPAMFEPRMPANAFECTGHCQECRRTPESTVPLCWELKPGEAIKFRYSYEKDR
jgi:hypothetical protein